MTSLTTWMILRSVVVLLALTVATGVIPPAATAQDIEAVRLSAENDNFNFWTPVEEQTDFEYTHGTRFEVDTRSVHAWQRRIYGGTKACSKNLQSADPCVSGTWSLTHQIYTPRTNSTELVRSERPYAGWLALGAATHKRSVDRRQSLNVEVGFTGAPSLAEASQVLIHEIGRFWRPLGWDNQLPFEPAILIGYETQARHAASRGNWNAETVGGFTANLGNLRTSLEPKVEVRSGYRVRHPWRPSVGDGDGLSATVFGGVSGAWVLHNMFLDGTLFRSGHSVARNPLIGMYELGFELAFGRLAGGFRYYHRSREYRTEPSGHSYTSLFVTIGSAGR